MALNKLKFNSLNVTPTASKGIGFNSNADGLEATFSGGAMTFIKKLTASSSATLSFVDGSSDVVLDNTYKEYIFVCKDIHPGTNGGALSFQASTDTGSSYGVTVTTTAFEAYHDEADSETAAAYSTSQDLAQSTNFKRVVAGTGSDNDQCCVGTLRLFNPSSTTFVKHFITDFQEAYHADYATHSMYAGYFNTTSAIDAIQFKMSSGNIDAGTITLYGIN
jgi:hypothetical protein